MVRRQGYELIALSKIQGIGICKQCANASRIKT
jgi:hypothetical protein